MKLLDFVDGFLCCYEHGGILVIVGPHACNLAELVRQCALAPVATAGNPLEFPVERPLLIGGHALDGTNLMQFSSLMRNRFLFGIDIPARRTRWHRRVDMVTLGAFDWFLLLVLLLFLLFVILVASVEFVDAFLKQILHLAEKARVVAAMV